MAKRTRSYRIGLMEELRDPVIAAHYVAAALEDSPDMFLVALRDVAEARQMSKVARDAEVSRESLYRMLSEEGNPRYSSLLGILRAVGLRLTIEPDLPSERAGGSEIEVSDSGAGDVPIPGGSAKQYNR